MLKIRICFDFLALIGNVLIAGGVASAQKQETSTPSIKIVKSLYQEDNSKAFIPQVGGMTDNDLQTKINNNLRTAILSLRNGSPNSSIHGDFEVSFYNGNLLGLHFRGDSFTPGTAHPNKIDCGIHIDLTTGEGYELADLFIEGADFEKRIKELCLLNESAYRLKMDGLAEGWTNKTFTSSWTGMDRAFLLSANSLRVYSIPSYARGTISGYNVPYADLTDIINKDGELWKKLKSQEVRAIVVTAE